jgi:hypothetical protein
MSVFNGLSVVHDRTCDKHDVSIDDRLELMLLYFRKRKFPKFNLNRMETCEHVVLPTNVCNGVSLVLNVSASY